MWNFSVNKNRIALLDESGNQLSYGELEYEGDKLATVIDSRCLVFALCLNQIGSVVGYSAFLNHNIVPVLLNANLDEGLLKNLLETYKPKFIWIPDFLVDKFRIFESVYSSFHYVLLKTNYETDCCLADDLFLLLTTSGSTGSPKLVRQSCENVLTNAQSIIKYMQLDESERPITTLPMNYTYGLSIINSHLLVGATLLLTEHTLVQREFWDFFECAQATSFGGVPYTYDILNKLHFLKKEYPALRTMTQAGGKLSPELHKKFAEYAQEQGKNFVVMYGQTEATARMSYLPPERSLEKYGSIGIAIPGGTFSLIDAEGNEIDQAEVVGELVYKGANVTLGYAETLEDLSKGDERHGTLITGDMAIRDRDGFYYIVGRKKRFLKIYGNRVNLDEIELMVKEAYEGMECASTGIDDHMYIFITDTSGCNKVEKFVAEKTGLNFKAFKVIAIEAIPLNEAGKILYKELELYYKE